MLLLNPFPAPHVPPSLQSSICTELIRRLLAFRAALNAASGAAAELDCLLALADVARDNGYCRPVLVEEPVLEIVGGEAREFGADTPGLDGY